MRHLIERSHDAGVDDWKSGKARGVGIDIMRFYERKGLIADPPRDASGYRHYPEDAVTRLCSVLP
jgi:DNA-binding transcriptional MerR regulator